MASDIHQQADLTKLTIAQLSQLCRDNGLTGYSKRRKSGIIELLEKRRVEKGVLIQSQVQPTAAPGPASTSTAKKPKTTTTTTTGNATAAPVAIAPAPTANTSSIHVFASTDTTRVGSQNANTGTAASGEPTTQKSTTKKKPKKRAANEESLSIVRNDLPPPITNKPATSASICADGQAQTSDSVIASTAPATAPVSTVSTASIQHQPIPGRLSEHGGSSAVGSQRRKAASDAVSAAVDSMASVSATQDPTVARALHFLDQVAMADTSSLNKNAKSSVAVAKSSAVALKVASARPPASKGHQVGNGFSSSSRILDMNRLSSIKRAQRQMANALPLPSLLRRRSSRASGRRRISKGISGQERLNDSTIPNPLQSSAIANSTPHGKVLTSRKSIGKHQRFTPLWPTTIKSPSKKKKRDSTNSFTPASALQADTREMFQPFVATLQEATFPLSNITMPPSLAQRKRVKGLALVLRDLGNSERRACCLSSRLLRYAGKIGVT
jgi:hypothetical protein